MARIDFTIVTATTRRLAAAVFMLLAGAAVAPASALTFTLPPDDVDIVGQVQFVEISEGQTLLEIGRQYGVGYREMEIANPGVDMWVPAVGTLVAVPTRFILPDAPREGVVVNVAEMRLYYYPEPESGERAVVETYAVSIGRQDWTTPLGVTKITGKVENPNWYVPDSILKQAAEQGIDMPEVVPPGPENPLGEYKIRLGIPGYLIHGTNDPRGVGMRVTHGCIRMYPEDIESLFPRLPKGTPVRLVNQPVKAGWAADSLYVEAHPPLEGGKHADQPLQVAVSAIAQALRVRGQEQVNYERLLRTLEQRNGIPEPVLQQQARQTPAASGEAATDSGEKPASRREQLVRR